MANKVPEVILQLDKVMGDIHYRVSELASDYEDLVAMARKVIDSAVERENRRGVDEVIVDEAALEMLREELP